MHDSQALYLCKNWSYCITSLSLFHVIIIEFLGSVIYSEKQSKGKELLSVLRDKIVEQQRELLTQNTTTGRNMTERKSTIHFRGAHRFFRRKHETNGQVLQNIAWKHLANTCNNQTHDDRLARMCKRGLLIYYATAEKRVCLDLKIDVDWT